MLQSFIYLVFTLLLMVLNFIAYYCMFVFGFGVDVVSWPVYIGTTLWLIGSVTIMHAIKSSLDKLNKGDK